jgi:hypothetical protein
MADATRTNVTSTGYDYSGQHFDTQNRTDSQGNTYSVDIPTSISSASTAPVDKTVPLTAPTYNTSQYVADGNKALSYVDLATQEAQANYDKTVQEGMDKSTDIEKLMASLGGKTADVSAAYSEVDDQGNSVNTLAAKLRRLNAEAQGLNYDNLAKTLAEQNKATGQNVTSTAVQRNTADATRENTIKLAGIGIQSAIAKADYDTAKELKDAQVNAKYDKITAEIAAKQTNLEALKTFKLTPAQQKLADATTRQLKKEETDAQKKREDELKIGDLIINANQQKAPKNIIDAANNAAKAGKSPLEVANILGVYAGDYKKSILLDEQIKTERFQQANYAANTKKTNIESGLTPDGKVDPNAPVTFKPLDESQSKNFSYAKRADESSAIISRLAPEIVKMNPVRFKYELSLASSPLTSGQASPAVRQYYQATKNYTTATLRRESGASIAPSEFDDSFSIAVPFPGDDDATLAQKSQKRNTDVTTFKAGVPLYDKRVAALATPEDKYLDTVTGAIDTVDKKVSNPVSSYLNMLDGLPGVKN